MVSYRYVEKLVNKLKRSINRKIKQNKIEKALEQLYACACILYISNIYYRDDELENALKSIAKGLKLKGFADKEDYLVDIDRLVFYDGFGFNDRGLAQIYLRALCKVRKVTYITFADRKGSIPDIERIVKESGGELRYITEDKRDIVSCIMQINSIIKEIRPKQIVFYSYPDDVYMTPVMYAYREQIEILQINLTDHAFWLGAGCIDKCLEFREYGANISVEYREIDKDRIAIIPFYPIISKTEFKGYPFNKKNGQKVIFSGGALYKTIGDDNKYYRMVDHILNKHDNVIFWYAGSGDDTEIRKLIEKYPERVYFTAERPDLFRILENIDIYLSTYPMCGGLMFQYAALAGKVPVTLKSGEISDGFLLDQDNIKVEFNNIDTLYTEIDRLLEDGGYAKERGIVMKNAVISSSVFGEELTKVINNEASYRYTFSPRHIDTEKFRSLYLERITKWDLMEICGRYNRISNKFFRVLTKLKKGK